ncbi:MAG: hypothetical protein B5766_10255 [Candidatus Lumbricidophila eiseniae]|uniref:Uncharacterized protein n=1 Tax=Candidatus Lumbricidiphila eiseniae TaxID=1969409 RepID=A0A2A6FPP5_9MICO|nr:MAG: hypothetical protein B5766_10255 [Candidatus Lumbricidophila eiseniae]
MSMSQKLFPVRERCKICRKQLGAKGAPVLFGLYCSAKCAGIAEPVQSATHANTPRECRILRREGSGEGQWVFKHRYRSEAEIDQSLREDPSTSWYWCNHCGHLHLGRTYPFDFKQAELFGKSDNGYFEVTLDGFHGF